MHTRNQPLISLSLATLSDVTSEPTEVTYIAIAKTLKLLPENPTAKFLGVYYPSYYEDTQAGS